MREAAWKEGRNEGSPKECMMLSFKQGLIPFTPDHSEKQVKGNERRENYGVWLHLHITLFLVRAEEGMKDDCTVYAWGR